LPCKRAIIIRFSLTVSFGATAVSCGERLIISFTLSACFLKLFPNIKASPLVGSVRQLNILIVVVFPAPFEPSIAKNSPCLILSERELTAVKFPYRFVKSLISIAFILCPPFEMPFEKLHYNRPFSVRQSLCLYQQVALIARRYEYQSNLLPL